MTCFPSDYIYFLCCFNIPTTQLSTVQNLISKCVFQHINHPLVLWELFCSSAHRLVFLESHWLKTWCLWIYIFVIYQKQALVQLVTGFCSRAILELCDIFHSSFFDLLFTYWLGSYLQKSEQMTPISLHVLNAKVRYWSQHLKWVNSCFSNYHAPMESCAA